MKKLLALVLTLVMTMSLMTVSNAATFSDDANIDYKEAVEVMAAVGVLAGDGTGAFDADGKLTRAAAAKIVTYLMIGSDAAEGLAASGAKFSDVAASFWGAGYIEYLAGEGVVAGVGDGKFDPNGEVTALQFAKMLLVALGYNAENEKLVGADWSIATSKLASKNKLFKGNDAVKVNSVATRQEAALYAFNALKAETVEYDGNAMSVTIGDTTIAQGLGKAETDGTLLMDELYEGALKLSTSETKNGFGHPANKWTYKAKEIGVFASAPVVTFTTAFCPNELIEAVETAGYAFDTETTLNAEEDPDVSIAVFENGVAGTSKAPATTKSFIETNPKTDYGFSANGVKVEFFANDDDIINRMVVTESTLLAVEDKREDKVGTPTIDERAVYLEGSLTIDADVAGFEDIFASVEAGDKLVAVLKTEEGTTTVLKVYAPTAVTGDVSYYKATSSLTVAGTNYGMNKNYSGSVDASDEGITLYIDEFGYAIGAEGGDDAAASAVVLSKYSGLNANGAIVDMALVLYADGTTARVATGTMTGYTASTVEGGVYLYDVNDDDEVCFANIPSASAEVTDADAGETFALGTQEILESAKAVTTYGANRTFFAAGVKFIYVNAVDGVQKFTVSDKLQAITVSESVKAAVVIDDEGYVSTMYVLGASAKNTVKDGSALVFIADFDGEQSKLDATGKKVTVYGYDAYIDGVKVEGFISEDDLRVEVGGELVVAPEFFANEYDTENGWYVLSGNSYDDSTEDVKVGAVTFTKDSLEASKYVVVDGTDVELISATKYASNVDEESVDSLAELKALVVDEGSSAEISVVYDDETGVALYVYVTAYTA